ncbi:MAG: glycogen/starch synthase [Muribaculaceae bacterium]|nr:glycogen/starch synthase [Muribaculaceae bacterium]
MTDLLFETSWEVCNKVGGIYAVLSTKAKTLQSLYKDKVIFIGPDVWSPVSESPDFDECRSLLDDWRKGAQLPDGIEVRTGRWNVPGRPLAILVSFRHLQGHINELYGQMWEQYRVDSLHGYGDYDEACAFAYAAARVIESIVNHWKRKAPEVVAHFDEWTTGMGLLYVKAHLPQVRTVFTTHATSIGRSIAGNGKPLYDYMAGYNGDQMARELNMESKHSLEKAAAHAADVFTTVSEVTARECEQLLERRPLVTPNAFEQRFVPKGKALAEARDAARARLLQVVESLTGQTLPSDTMLIATSGRCEFRNKGIDLYLDALNVMRTLVHSNVQATRPVVAFVLVPSWVDCPRADLVSSINNGLVSRLPNPVVTHELHQPDHDVVLCKMRDVNFNNKPDDRLMVIDVPCYLNGHDGVLGLSYYDVLVGIDLTVFPSYYEPWGYTPLESIAFGVPTITTNLAGFGQWVIDQCGHDASRSGVTVLHRTDSNYSETVHALAAEMMQYYHLSPADKQRRNRAAQATSKQAQWKQFIEPYQEAYSNKKAIL